LHTSPRPGLAEAKVLSALRRAGQALTRHAVRASGGGAPASGPGSRDAHGVRGVYAASWIENTPTSAG